jgi:hypothetical protein
MVPDFGLNRCKIPELNFCSSVSPGAGVINVSFSVVEKVVDKKLKLNQDFQ